MFLPAGKTRQSTSKIRALITGNAHTNKTLQAAILTVLLKVLLKLNGYMEYYLLGHWGLSAILKIIRAYTK